MKLEALDHPKTLDLAARLDIGRPTAIGHLELLWAFAAKYTPQGDIGKHPDGAIARACDWMGRPEIFVAALVDAGFLDVDDTYRLIVHDWSDHAQSWVRAKLARAGHGFVPSVDETEETTTEGSTEPTKDASSCARVSKPSLAKPSQEKSREPGAVAPDLLGDQVNGSPKPELALHETLPRDAWAEWLAFRRERRFPMTPRTLAKQLDLLAQFPTDVQREMLDASIRSGWQGIFPPKGPRSQTDTFAEGARRFMEATNARN